MVDFEVVPSESQIEQKFVNWCNDRSLLPVKLNITGRRGFPDRMVLGNDGKMLFLEFKRPGGSTTKLQKHMIEGLANRGFKAFVVESYEDAKHICERYL